MKVEIWTPFLVFLKNKYLKPDLHSSSRDPLSRCKTTTVFISSTELGALQDFWTQLIFAVANIKRGAILKQNQSAPVAVFGYLTLILSAQTCSSAPERQTVGQITTTVFHYGQNWKRSPLPPFDK